MHYDLYGLTLAFDRELQGLRPALAGREPDVRVHLDDAPEWADDDVAVGGTVFRGGQDAGDVPLLVVEGLRPPTGVRFRYADGHQFWVRADTREIWVRWPDTQTLADSIIYLIGPILSYVLRRRGVLALHGSAVAVGDGCIGFVGPSGAGKSTLAGAFAAQRYAVLTDDVIAVREGSRGVTVATGYPFLRLNEDSAELLSGAADHQFPLVGPNWDKHAMALDAVGSRMPDRAVPLSAVCLLRAREADLPAGSDGVALERLTPAGALVELGRNTLAVHTTGADVRRTEFAQLSALVRRIPVFALSLSSDSAVLAQSVARLARGDWWTDHVVGV